MKGPKDGDYNEILNEMAKAFGKDGANPDQEAGKLWSKLTELHESDPSAYQSFIQKQMNEAKTHSARGSIIPNKGFVVKAFTKGFKIFINFCYHEAISRPLNIHGQEFQLNVKNPNLSDIQIPLVVSELRTTLVAHSVDVVLHPWCLMNCGSNAKFKSDIVTLGISAVEEDRKIPIDKQWKFIKSQYKGGIGSNNDEVHPLPIRKNDGTEYGNIGEVMENPSTLLQSLHINRPEIDDDDAPSFSLKTNNERGSENKHNLIEEIGKTYQPSKMNQVDPRKENKSVSGAKKKPHLSLMREVTTRNKCSKDSSSGDNDDSSQAISKIDTSLAKEMKGFLNREKNGSQQRKPLYGKPSTGDGTSGKGGAYSKFMSKCQVVTLENDGKKKEEGFKSSMKMGFLNKSSNANTPNAMKSDAVDAQMLHQMISEVTSKPSHDVSCDLNESACIENSDR